MFWQETQILYLRDRGEVEEVITFIKDHPDFVEVYKTLLRAKITDIMYEIDMLSSYE